MNVMRTTVATVVAATLSMSAFSVFAAASLTGAGATFPAPVYAKWADTYNKETGNKINYQGIGSSGGVNHCFEAMVSKIGQTGDSKMYELLQFYDKPKGGILR